MLTATPTRNETAAVAGFSARDNAAPGGGYESRIAGNLRGFVLRAGLVRFLLNGCSRQEQTSMMKSRAELGRMAVILQGIPVWGCLPGSPAHQAGIGYGDILLSVNGVRTKTMKAYVAARHLRDDGAEFVVFRDGAEVTVDFRFTHPTEGFSPLRESRASALS
jgi:S1-C subfamily serine protease